MVFTHDDDDDVLDDYDDSEEERMNSENCSDWNWVT